MGDLATAGPGGPAQADENFVIPAANKWGRGWEGRPPAPSGGEGAPASASGRLPRPLPGPGSARPWAPRCTQVRDRLWGAGSAGRAHLFGRRAPRTRRARGRRTGRGAAASGRCHCGASSPRVRGGRRRGRGRMAREARAGARDQGATGAPAPGQGEVGPGAGRGWGRLLRGSGRGARALGLAPRLGQAGLDWAGRREPRPGLDPGPPRSRRRWAGRPGFKGAAAPAAAASSTRRRGGDQLASPERGPCVGFRVRGCGPPWVRPQVGRGGGLHECE